MGSNDKTFEKVEFNGFFILKMYFILFKISYYRVINAQKRKNGVILGGNDVTGDSWGLFLENFGRVKFGQHLYFENFPYFSQIF